MKGKGKGQVNMWEVLVIIIFVAVLFIGGMYAYQQYLLARIAG